MTTPLLSVVIPVYGNKLDLRGLYSRLCSALSAISDNFEIIMINDKSPDNAWLVISELARQDSRVRGINLSRNFGQHYALTAGLDYMRGEWCILMDCDLQDQPEEIIKFFEKTKEGFDIVVGQRVQRKDTVMKKVTSWAFYAVFNFLTDQQLNSGVANFGIYSRQVIDAIKLHREHDRSIGLLASIVGFKKTVIAIDHAPRGIGTSAYRLKSRLRLAEDHILSHSTKPLRIAISMGGALTCGSFFYAAMLVVRYFFSSTVVPGWYSLTVSLFFLSGVIMLLIGIVGLYAGKIYNEVKQRPLYIVHGTTFEVES
jgi:dolichol-phosphate mannosyltransferase